MKWLTIGAGLIVVAVSCSGGDDTSGANAVLDSGLDASTGGRSGTGGSGGLATGGGAGASGSAGSSGSAGISGSAGSAGTVGCGVTSEGCHTCGQLPGQAHSADCNIGPPDLCGFAVPNGDAGEPSKSAAKFFALVDCMCGSCSEECNGVCNLVDPPQDPAPCLACAAVECKAENKACDDDNGS